MAAFVDDDDDDLWEFAASYVEFHRPRYINERIIIIIIVQGVRDCFETVPIPCIDGVGRCGVPG